MIIETTTPGEFKARSNGMRLIVGVAPSPFGECLIADSARGICHLSFFDSGGEATALAELSASWLHAEIHQDAEHAAALVARIFSPVQPSESPMRVCISGTDFQLRVWRELLRVPPGACISYAMLAAAAGHPRACRATGSAVGANPVCFLIPCHRVIRSDGSPGQYRWGADRKRAMLAWEKNNAAPANVKCPIS